MERVLDAIATELDQRATELATDPNIGTIYFGGGTPSLIPTDRIAAYIDQARKLFNVAEDAEITLEANPTSVEAARFRGYRAAGVNRLSLGVQSLDDRELKFLGRRLQLYEPLRIAAVGGPGGGHMRDHAAAQ